MSNFYGLPVSILENDHIRLEYLADVGPRIVRLSFHGGPNLLAELPDSRVETPFGLYFIRGGHRLWSAPESMPGSYTPDNDGLLVEPITDGVRLTGTPDPDSGVVKSIEIQLVPELATIKLKHELLNDGPKSVLLAPWALTMLRPGGVAILPQPIGNADPLGFRNNRILALWPYTQINDPRLVLRDDFILLRATASPPRFKIGYFNPHGWLAYWLDGVLFQKTFEVHPGAAYPDGGCNAEVYCDHHIIELESLGELTTLEPGDSASLVETWELFDSLEQPFLPESIQGFILRGF